jgi:hypothetical protein
MECILDALVGCGGKGWYREWFWKLMCELVKSDERPVQEVDRKQDAG